MKLKYAQLSSAGPVRKNNEDWLGFWEPSDEEEYRARGAVVALADGVGGHGDGEMASQLAVEVALRRFLEVKPDTAPRQALSKMFTSANIAVYDRGMQLRMPSRMCYHVDAVDLSQQRSSRRARRRLSRLSDPRRPHSADHDRPQLCCIASQVGVALSPGSGDQRHAHRSHAQRRERTDGASRLSHRRKSAAAITMCNAPMACTPVLPNPSCRKSSPTPRPTMPAGNWLNWRYVAAPTTIYRCKWWKSNRCKPLLSIADYRFTRKRPRQCTANQKSARRSTTASS